MREHGMSATRGPRCGSCWCAARDSCARAGPGAGVVLRPDAVARSPLAGVRDLPQRRGTFGPGPRLEWLDFEQLAAGRRRSQPGHHPRSGLRPRASEPLLIDLAPQGNCGHDLGYAWTGGGDEGAHLVNCLVTGEALKLVIRDARPNLDVISGGSRLDDLDDVVAGRERRGEEGIGLLRDSMQSLVLDYDLVIIDTPPSRRSALVLSPHDDAMDRRPDQVGPFEHRRSAEVGRAGRDGPRPKPGPRGPRRGPVRDRFVRDRSAQERR